MFNRFYSETSWEVRTWKTNLEDNMKTHIEVGL
jgi:hypothetical protein